MGRFQRSWALFGRSFQVLRENRKLLLFPVIIKALMLLIVAFFAVPLATMKTGYAITDTAHWEAVGQTVGITFDKGGRMHQTGSFYGIAAVVYLVSMFLATFCNVAFYHEILTALNGQPVSISRGFRFAASRLRAIAAWSLFSGLVGLIIKSIEERVGVVGRIVVRLIGIGWSIASVFAIPVIVREGASANPVQVLKSSARMLKKYMGRSAGRVCGDIGGHIPGVCAVACHLAALARGRVGRGCRVGAVADVLRRLPLCARRRRAGVQGRTLHLRQRRRRARAV